VNDFRVIIVVLDGVGCGFAVDAAKFGDAGSNTLQNLSRAAKLKLPNLQRLGLGNIVPLNGVPMSKLPKASVGMLAEQSAGKDSTCGHWELAGVITAEPFPLFPHGFPPELLRQFEQEIGRKTIGNCPASGTEIISRLGDEHVRTGAPIVYTSADSVFQVACHEDVIPPEQLYSMCATARRLLDGPNRVARVIARPFVGKSGSYQRTTGRKDFSCPAPKPTLLDNVKAAARPVIAIGKVDDLFAGRGFTESRHSVKNDECVGFLLDEMDKTKDGLIFANLVQFDMDWGHRNDVRGFARGLAEFDRRLPEIERRLKPGDLLFITADHGNDPTTPSTDHSRECVPLIALGPGLRLGMNLGTRPTFADLGQTAAEFLGVAATPDGTSFLELLRPQPGKESAND
jgi:phosphopentomutase